MFEFNITAGLLIYIFYGYGHSKEARSEQAAQEYVEMSNSSANGAAEELPSYGSIQTGEGGLFMPLVLFCWKSSW